jgi:hypothetical protein
MQDIIYLLLQKKADLRAEIEREFAARNQKIDALLDLAGYIPPVEESAPDPVLDGVNVEQPQAY